MKLTSFSKEHEIACVDRATENLAYREILHNTLDVVFRIQGKGKVSSEDLDVFRIGMECPNQIVWDRVGGWLEKISQHDSQGLKFLRELAGSKAWITRFNVCATVANRPFQRDFQVSLLRRFFGDRSLKVREKTTDGCLRYELTELIPDLELMLQDPKNKRIRASIMLAIDLAQDKPHRLGKSTIMKEPNGNQWRVQFH